MKSGKPLAAKAKARKPPTVYGKNGQQEKIVFQAYEQIIKGHMRENVLEFLQDAYQLTDDESIKIYDLAWAYLNKIAEGPTIVKFNFAESALLFLYQKMVSIGDYAGALAAVKEFSKLNALSGIKTNPESGQKKTVDSPRQAGAIHITDSIFNDS